MFILTLCTTLAIYKVCQCKSENIQIDSRRGRGQHERQRTNNKQEKEGKEGKRIESEKGKTDSGLQEEVCGRGNIGQHLHLSTTEERAVPAC